ncbi:MAG: MerR family transcriptional regulator [Ilumatobacteraceae bacterium]
MAEPGPAHLSIGEVLGLLLEEFPDVTISKIRFLESQGLIEPERTPSGYRKFFDDDVELLRVILREQREKFLPLRVIKDRLDSGQIETPDPTPPRGAASEQPTPATVANHPAASRSGPPRSAEPAALPASSPAPDRSASATTRLLPGVLLSREELCAMASVTNSQLADLEEYGVVPKRTGPSDLYGEDAVEIASAAGGFLRAGVDARHLRTWRTSVEREAGLYEQLILPVLRQRNPQSRSAAAIHIDELEALGTRLRAAMMRAALRQYLE